MHKKNGKKIKKKEELPSFLLNLSSHNLERKPEKTRPENFSNPIFFGFCNQYHGILHPVSLGAFHRPQYSTISEDSINSGLFLPEHELIQKVPEIAKVHPSKKRKKEFVDLYSHRCPGVRKAFVPDIKIFTPDTGRTTSEIESETWREIPFCRVKSNLLWESSEPEIENVMLSDIKEKNRAFLPYEQRMAHYHFPKEFVTVKLVGPDIPASITVTKIPSKRKRISFEVEEKVAKGKSAEKITEDKETQDYTEMEEERNDEEEEEEEEEEEVEAEAEEEEVVIETFEEKSKEVENNDETEEKENEEEQRMKEKDSESRVEIRETQNEIMVTEGDEEEVIVDEGENFEDDKIE